MGVQLAPRATKKRKKEHKGMQQSNLFTVDGIKLVKRHSNGSLTPEYWPNGVDDKGRAKCASNVAYVTWNAGRMRWQAQKQRADGPCVHIGNANASKHGGDVGRAFAAACALRRGVEDESPIKGTVVVDDATGAIVMTRCIRPTCMCGTNVPIAMFAPDPRGNDRAAFEAFEAHAELVGDADVPAEERAASLAFLQEYATSTCFRCRAIKNKSNHEGPNNEIAKCFDMAEKIRADMRARGGCVHCGYIGPALQCDHAGRLGKPPGQTGMLDPPWWALNGGAKAMWEHYKTYCRPLCSFCHFLEPTHDIHKGADSTKMPDVRHCDDSAAYRSKRARQYAEACMKINHAWKRDAGCCVYCWRVCYPGTEHAFHWMHNAEKMAATTKRLGLKSPRVKKYTISALQCSGIYLATFIAHAKPEIDECCKLGCANCHFDHETLPEQNAQVGRLKAFVNAWAARGGIRVVRDDDGASASADVLVPPAPPNTEPESDDDEDEYPWRLAGMTITREAPPARESDSESESDAALDCVPHSMFASDESESDSDE